MNNMKAYKIDSKANLVFEIDLPSGKELLKAMQDVVGGYIEHGYFLDSTDEIQNVIYVDEEGAFKYDYGFSVDGALQPFLGNGLICGLNPNTGEIVDVTFPLTKIAEILNFGSMLKIGTA